MKKKRKLSVTRSIPRFEDNWHVINYRPLARRRVLKRSAYPSPFSLCPSLSLTLSNHIIPDSYPS